VRFGSRGLHPQGLLSAGGSDVDACKPGVRSQVCTRTRCYPLAVAMRVGANRKAPDIGTTAHMLMVGEAGPIWITAVIQLGTADRSAA
jgi:hypothetical protein